MTVDMLKGIKDSIANLEEKHSLALLDAAQSNSKLNALAAENLLLKAQVEDQSKQSAILHEAENTAIRSRVLMMVPKMGNALLNNLAPLPVDMFSGSSMIFAALNKAVPDIELAKSEAGIMCRLSSGYIMGMSAAIEYPMVMYEFIRLYYDIYRPEAFAPVPSTWAPPSTLKVDKSIQATAKDRALAVKTEKFGENGGKRPHSEYPRRQPQDRRQQNGQQQNGQQQNGQQNGPKGQGQQNGWGQHGPMKKVSWM